MNVDAMTTCNAPLITDPDKVRDICDKYRIMSEDEPDFGPFKDGKKWRLSICAWGWFALYPFLSETGEDAAPGEVDWDADTDKITRRFLKEIQPYLEDELVIESMDHEGLHFPFGAHVLIVPPKKGKVLHAWLPCDRKEFDILTKRLSKK